MKWLFLAAAAGSVHGFPSPGGWPSPGEHYPSPGEWHYPSPGDWSSPGSHWPSPGEHWYPSPGEWHYPSPGGWSSPGSHWPSPGEHYPSPGHHEECADTPGFVDEWGGRLTEHPDWQGTCGEWADYGCERAVEEWGYSQQGENDLVANCRGSCGLCISQALEDLDECDEFAWSEKGCVVFDAEETQSVSPDFARTCLDIYDHYFTCLYEIFRETQGWRGQAVRLREYRQKINNAGPSAKCVTIPKETACEIKARKCDSDGNEYYTCDHDETTAAPTIDPQAMV